MNLIKSKLKNREFVFSALVYVLLFIFLLYPYRDYDWGWHFKNGEYFLKHGKILVSDQYSWTMAGYKWVNHEWLYDPLEYLIFSMFSFLGMSVAGAAVAFSWFYLGIKRYNLSYWQKGILALFFANLIGGVIWQGLRVQMLGTLFLAVFIYFVPNIIKRDKKTLIFLPFMFLLWANSHGYFIIGLSLFALVLGGQLIGQIIESRAKKEVKLFLSKSMISGYLSFVVCILATLVNPFTYHLYLEGLRHLSNPLLKYILEWIPFQLNSGFSAMFFAYTLFIAGFFIKRRKLSDLPYIFIFAFILYYALSARRYVSPYAAVTLPMAAFFIKKIPWRFEKYKTTAFIFLIGCVIGFQIGLFRRIPNYHLLTYTFTDYCNFGSSCSEGMVEYLKKHPPKGRGFNFYDWGGYMIGRNVPAKLFVDGRMHLWKNDKTGYSAFSEYQSMYYDGDWKKFSKYDFDWLILSTNSLLFEKLNDTKELGTWTAEYMDQNGVYAVRKR